MNTPINTISKESPSQPNDEVQKREAAYQFLDNLPEDRRETLINRLNGYSFEIGTFTDEELEAFLSTVTLELDPNETIDRVPANLAFAWHHDAHRLRLDSHTGKYISSDYPQGSLTVGHFKSDIPLSTVLEMLKNKYLLKRERFEASQAPHNPQELVDYLTLNDLCLVKYRHLMAPLVGPDDPSYTSELAREVTNPRNLVKNPRLTFEYNDHPSSPSGGAEDIALDPRTGQIIKVEDRTLYEGANHNNRSIGDLNLQGWYWVVKVYAK